VRDTDRVLGREGGNAMKLIVICLLALLLYFPVAIAQEQPEESVPDEPEVPMIDLPPEELPQSEGVWDADNPDRPFFPYSRVPSEASAKPRTIPKLSPPVPGIDQGNLPPGYVARAQCHLLYEEEIENGAAIFGIKPNKHLRDGQWEDWYPKVCRQKNEDELPPTPPPPQPPNWASKLPSGYVARAARCDEGEEEVENGAVLFGLEPIKIRWEDQLVDWLPKVCHKKG
jgi:hypothetical protein